MMRGLVAALVTAATFVMAAGCSSTVRVGSGSGDGCPAAEPESGTSCDDLGTSCDYQEGPCFVTLTCSADGHTWAQSGATCTPAAVDCSSAQDGDVCATVGDSCGEGASACGGGYENTCGDDHRWHTDEYYGDGCCSGSVACPVMQPSEGEGCDPCWDSSSCDYEGFCGGAHATCGPDGVWHVAIGDCPPPPPPMDPCAAYGAAADCAAAGCRWLVPGCGEPALPQAGCFAAADCTPADCSSPNYTCQEVVADPCWDAGCGACGASAFLCLPN